MKIISSYGVELRKQNIPIRQTLEIYRSAVSYLIGIYVQVWEELAEIPDAKRRFNAAEHLVHTTKKNHACFDFDIRFPKMPSYLRRSAIQHALGTVSSYKTRLDLWEKTARKSGKPKLVYENHAMPVFYRDVMYREGAEGKDEAYLKLYDGHDWKWFCVRLEHTDMEYLRKCWSGKKASAPTLEKRHRKYFLRFSYTEEVTLTKTPVKEQIICSVDLGINTDAVCTIMRADGTVLGRRFIDHPSEKDRMYRTLGRIRRFQREHGSAQTQGRWAYTKRLNTELGKKIAGAIVRYAEENHADVIVFEYLEMQGKISGKKKQKLHLWRKRDIQRCCEHQAHRKGIRVSRICAWNTSTQRIIDEAPNSVSTVQMPMKASALIDTVNDMLYHLERRIKKEKKKPKPRSEKEQNYISNAKRLLMEKNQMTEEEAYRHIQKCSMDSGTNMVETAQMVLSIMAE